MKRLVESECENLNKSGYPVACKRGILFNKTTGQILRDVVVENGYAFRGFIKFRGKFQPTYELIEAHPRTVRLLTEEDTEWKIISRKEWWNLQC